MAKKWNKPTYQHDIGGMTPPHDSDLEGTVLGAILLETDSFDLIASILKPEYFYKEEHQLIFKAVTQLAVKNEPIDIRTVSIELKKNGDYEIVGGGYAVANLTTNVASAANIEHHSRLICQFYLLREMIRISTDCIRKAYQHETDCFDLIDQTASEVSNLLNGIESKSAKPIGEIKDEVIQACKDALMSEKPTGVPISISALQRHTNGWRNGNLIILAARPGMGKTAVALDFAYHPASEGIPTAFFSLEMTAQELAARQMSKLSYIPSQKITNSATDTHELTNVIRDTEVMNKVPLYIDDTPSLSIVRLRSKAFRLKREKKIELIVVDYLQLMEGADDNNFNREQEISKISRGLKKLAKELEIPVIALSQLSRKVEERPGGAKRPQLSDLRDSGAIEQDADMVMFIHRPEYYGITEYDHVDEHITNTHELMLIIIAKFRHGSIGDLKARWKGFTTSITNWDNGEPIEEQPAQKQIAQQTQIFTSSNGDAPF